MGPDEERHAIDDVVTRLTQRFPDTSAETVAEVVRRSYQGFEQSHVRDFIPVLVEHDARLELSRTAPAR